MKNDLGIILIKNSNDNACDIIYNTIRKIIDNNPMNQVLIFSSEYDRINTLNIPTMHLKDAYFFYGNLLLLDIIGCLVTQDFPNINKRYLYASDLYWTKSRPNIYKKWEKIIYHDNLDIIASNKTINDIYSVCWKDPVGIVENFNYEELHKIIGR